MQASSLRLPRPQPTQVDVDSKFSNDPVDERLYGLGNKGSRVM